MFPTLKPQSGESRWYNIVTNMTTRHADIYLYGVIGGWYANVQQFLADLSNAGDVDTITVYLNTVGGSFYDGLPIYNTLDQHKAKVTIKVMGYALSMGSVIMLAGDVVEAAENALIMIHRAQGEVWGSADDMQRAADVLIKHEQAILPEYMRRLGKTANQVQALLNAETWYTAAEAKAAGLVDIITQPVTQDAAAATMQTDSWQYVNQHYRNVHPSFKSLTNQGNKPMNQDDIQVIANAVVTAMNNDQDTVSKRKYDLLMDDYNDIKTKHEGLKQQLADANAKLAEIAEKEARVQAEFDKKLAAETPPINTGPAGSYKPFWG